jgi:hypothetical protein
MTKNQPIKDLGNGLLLKRSTPADIERIAAFQTKGFAEKPELADDRIAVWVRDLLSGKHPTFGQGDFTFVEDSKTREIVSSLCLIDQIWNYEGISFKVGRPELVVTLPEYRNRGLIREQFDVVHAWSAERGQILQFITGIPYYYRNFGYEMALDTEAGRNVYEFHLPRLKENEAESFTFRPAELADIPFIMQMYAQSCRRSAINSVRTEAEWTYLIRDISADNCEREIIKIIETGDNQPIGLLIMANEIWNPYLIVFCLEIIPGYPWMLPCQAALRQIWKDGKALGESTRQSFNVIGLWLDKQHPSYEALPNRAMIFHDPYSLYIRIPDLVRFLNEIKPALEKRLAASPASGYSGELTLSFYKSLLRMEFFRGEIKQISRETKIGAEAQVSFPDKLFYHLLLGSKSLAELEAIAPDCWVKSYSDARVLLDALFPKKQSNVIPFS